MTLSNYPEQFDESNLHEVHDSLRLTLLEDYIPGDTKIYVQGDDMVKAKFPLTGIITLTEQMSDKEKRAIAFSYSNWDQSQGVFSGLELLPTFTDSRKSKNITNVTLNVMAIHHNAVKDALIALQQFCGTKGTVDTAPFGDTLEGRINFLRNIVLKPKAWFTAKNRTGNIPLEVEFTNLSFNLGVDGSDDGVKVTWDFGDHTTSTISNFSIISATSNVPSNAIDVLVQDTDSGSIRKVYHTPAIYDVKLTVENKFGKDVCIFPDYINARVRAPEAAVINFVTNAATQSSTAGVPLSGPYSINPTIRSPINTLIEIEIQDGENHLGKPGYSFAGEMLHEGQPIDRITSYTWSLGDDVVHGNSKSTKASYSVGGVYDLKLRVDTEFGAYRITTYENVIDIVENVNMWHWMLNEAETEVRAYEYGLISETYKVLPGPTYLINRDDSFITHNNAVVQAKMRREFKRNTSFVPKSTTASGRNGVVILSYASGRSSLDGFAEEKIHSVEFQGFTGVYIARPSLNRGWNWINFSTGLESNFLLGTVANYTPNQSPVNMSKQSVSLVDSSVATTNLTAGNLINGAEDLTQNISVYGTSGDSIYGDYSVYRTTWRGSTGYLVRNSSVGPFFRLASFYRTEGTVSKPVQNLRKLSDVGTGVAKVEGQLAGLSTGVYLLDNSGSISQFLPENNVWRAGGPGINSAAYARIQDSSVAGYDDTSNTFLSANDQDHRIYLSFDYSEKTLTKFNEIGMIFSTLGSRPAGKQWLMGIY